MYREDKYKRKFCSKYPDKISDCEYGDFCSFAHNENEIKIELIHNYVFDSDFYIFHYKTVWCPFNLTTHDKGLCVYAHNWQDYRRKPSEYDYISEACPHWKPNDYIQDYAQGCPNELSCDRCHGWKELEFHPLIYKMHLCRQGNKCKQEGACPQYHSEKDKRQVDKRVSQNLMRYYPKNRNIKGTFKNSRDSAPQSFSKSLDGHEHQGGVQHQASPQGMNSSRSKVVAARQGNDTLLKRSLKKEHAMNMSRDEDIFSTNSMGNPRPNYPYSSFKSNSVMDRPKTMSYNGSGFFDYGAHNSSSHPEEPAHPITNPHQRLVGAPNYQAFQQPFSGNEQPALHHQMNYVQRFSPNINNYGHQMQHCDSFDGSLGNAEFGDGQEFEDPLADPQGQQMGPHTPNYPSRFNHLRRNPPPADHVSIASHQDYQQSSRIPMSGITFAPDMRYAPSNHPMDKRSRSLMLEESKHEKTLTASKFRQRPLEPENQAVSPTDQEGGVHDGARNYGMHNYSQFSRPLTSSRLPQPFQPAEGQPTHFAPKREEESPKLSDSNKQASPAYEGSPPYADNGNGRPRITQKS